MRYLNHTSILAVCVLAVSLTGCKGVNPEITITESSSHTMWVLTEGAAPDKDSDIRIFVVGDKAPTEKSTVLMSAYATHQQDVSRGCKVVVKTKEITRPGIGNSFSRFITHVETPSD